MLYAVEISELIKDYSHSAAPITVSRLSISGLGQQ